MQRENALWSLVSKQRFGEINYRSQCRGNTVLVLLELVITNSQGNTFKLRGNLDRFSVLSHQGNLVVAIVNHYGYSKKLENTNNQTIRSEAPTSVLRGHKYPLELPS